MYAFQKKLTNSFYALLSLPATATGFGLSVQIATLSWIMSTEYHLEIEQVGYVWLAGPLAGIIAQPLVGLISDNVWFWKGRRRPFIWIGGIIAASMLFLLPRIDLVASSLDFLGSIANWLGVPEIMIVALFVALMLDLAINVSFNPTRSIIADVTPDGDQRTKGYTVMQSISNFFGLLAYLIGVVFGNMALIYFGVGLILLFTIIPPLFIKEPRYLDGSKSEEELAEEEGIIEEVAETIAAHKTTNLPELLKLYVAHGFTWVGVQTMFVFLFAFAQYKLNQDADSISDTINISFLLMNGMATIIPLAVFQPLSKRYNQINVHNWAIATMAVSYLLLTVFGENIYALYTLMALVGIGWAATVTLPFPIMSELVAKNRTGLYMGIFNLSVVIPQLLVTLFVGKYIEAAADKNIIFYICGAALTLSTLAWLLVKRSSIAGPTAKPNIAS